MLKQQIHLLPGKTTRAGSFKAVYQAFIRVNDQLVGPVVPGAGLGTLAQTPNTLKVWKWRDITIVLLPADRCAVLPRTLSPEHVGKVSSTGICNEMPRQDG